MATFSVKNFERYQHYKDRSPPWIKLYNDVLDDYQFGLLPDAAKAHLFAIWLLASRYENKIPYDAEWVSRRINATSTIDLQQLSKAGFIVLNQDCSITLADCKRDAIPERERETEAERERETPPTPQGERQTPAPDEVKEAFETYNVLAQNIGLPLARDLTEQRRRKIAARLRASGGLGVWHEALEKLRHSGLCRGDNDRGWRADIDFLCQAKSFQRLIEGYYDDRSGNKPADKMAAAVHSLRTRARAEEADAGPGAFDGGGVVRLLPGARGA